MTNSNKAIRTLCVCTLLSSLFGCNDGQTNNKREGGMAADTITTVALPAIPATLKTPELRADYLARHYWDNMNFADTNYIHHPEVMEQAWVNFIDILRLTTATTADTALKALFAQAGKEKKCHSYMASLADMYLYEPDSPMRDEELYTSALDAMLASSEIDDTEKIRLQARRELVRKNRVGTQASDFAYTLADGRQGRLHGIEAPYTLLFLNSPGCDACNETIRALEDCAAIRRATAQGRMKVLSVFPDSDAAAWCEHLADFPAEWINGYDKELTIERDNLYNLEAIPALYLLDKDKTVLLKDAAAGEIDAYLAEKGE